MTIKQYGGVFGRNPTFNDVTIDGELIINGSVFTGLDYEGAWNASTNTPTLTSSVGTLGQFYIVSVAGATDLNGITNWDVGDWALFNGSVWQRVEGGADGNFSTLSVSGLSSLNGGANVTGALTADGLTVKNPSVSGEQAILKIENAVNTGTIGKITFNQTDDRMGISNESSGSLSFDTATVERLNIASNGDISFYEDTGTTPKLFWDASAESLGIGTSSPSSELTIGADTPQIDLLKASSADVLANIRAETDAGTGGKLVFQTKRNGNTPLDRMTIDDDGNVGIATDSPAYLLHLEDSNGADLALSNSTAPPSAGDYLGRIYALDSTNGFFAGINMFYHDDNDGEIRFRVKTNGTNADVMTLVDGNVLVGKTTSSSATAGHELLDYGRSIHTANATTVQILNRLGNNDGDISIFQKDGTTVGSISVTASATAYNTSSDQRLKENIADADDAGAKIDAIQVRKYDWKVDGSHQDYGMVAQELQVVAPEAVSAPEDPEEMMGVDYSKLVPMMLKEIQSLRARIAALES